MPIDWFTVVAQIVNFLILVWLLKRFLYKPILDAIDARENRIVETFAEADKAKSEAQIQRDDYQQKNATFDSERAGLLSAAKDEAQAERVRILETARKDADAMSAKRRDEIHAEQQALSDEITRRTHQEVFSLARKLLQDLATVDMEEQMCDAFIHNLRLLNGEVKQELAKTQTTKQPTRVSSAFKLPIQQRSQIQAALNETLSADVNLEFETVPDLISGIELTVNGKKIAWSINEYLTSLEQQIGEVTIKES